MKTTMHHLLHPLLDVPAEARQLGYHRRAGIITRYLLLFADGYLAWLTADELTAAKRALADWERELAEEPCGTSTA
jgi:hypothetical protein